MEAVKCERLCRSRTLDRLDRPEYYTATPAAQGRADGTAQGRADDPTQGI